MWGNCSTMNSLPRVHEYSHALRLLNTIKPIKGSGCNAGMIPLGARNNVSAYSVRAGKTDETDVEFVLYQTPVITYKADGRIIVKMERWGTNTTREFISSILRVSCYATKGKSVLEINTGNPEKNPKSIVPPTGLVLRCVPQDPGSKTLPVLAFDADAKPVIYGYAINRTQNNNVRRRYSEFIKYFKASISLRKIQVEVKTYYATPEPSYYEAIEYTIGEAADVLGTTTQNSGHTGHIRLDNKWDQMYQKPTPTHRPQGWNTYVQWIEQYDTKCREFFSLIQNDQDEDTKHANFYKAFVILMATDGHTSGYSQPYRADDLTVVKNVDTATLRSNFEKVMKMYFAKTILETVVLKDGMPPNKTYTNWMWMYDAAEIAKADVLEAEYKKTSTRA